MIIIIIIIIIIGKTTIMYKCKFGEVTTTIPVIGMNVETVENKHISVSKYSILDVYLYIYIYIYIYIYVERVLSIYCHFSTLFTHSFFGNIFDIQSSLLVSWLRNNNIVIINRYCYLNPSTNQPQLVQLHLSSISLLYYFCFST